MHLCYIDESGTSSIPGNTSHFILAGISIPIYHWRDADREISRILARVGLSDAEVHTAWVLRNYPEQSKIPNFEGLNWDARRSAVERYRTTHLLNLQKQQKIKTYKQIKKNYIKTSSYIHLTRDERRQLISDIATCVGNWGFARLFAECIDKTHFDQSRTRRTVDEQAFEQIVSRFEQYLVKTDTGNGQNNNYGVLVHDNNQTVAKKHTELMRHFHQQGTLWTNITHLIETPLFVDSELTRMVQVADLCSYALRRYLENREEGLFNQIFQRADRFHNTVVGVRHYSDMSCTCKICQAHKSS